MKKNIIFDFGNVLVQWHPEHVYGEYFGDEAKAWWFLRHVADMDFRQRIDAGESFDGCIREKQAQYPEYEQAIELYRSRWREMLTDEVPGMREVIVELRGNNYELYGLTNWSMETFPEARERFGILQMIDRYVVSGAEGLVKPDPRLFQVLLDRYGLKAEECTFVDDNPDNVAAAQGMGMKGIVFVGAEDLRNQLRDNS
jgi:2-haloacid dehalogenase